MEEAELQTEDEMEFYDSWIHFRTMEPLSVFSKNKKYFMKLLRGERRVFEMAKTTSVCEAMQRRNYVMLQIKEQKLGALLVLLHSNYNNSSPTAFHDSAVIQQLTADLNTLHMTVLVIEQDLKVSSVEGVLIHCVTRLHLEVSMFKSSVFKIQADIAGSQRRMSTAAEFSSSSIDNRLKIISSQISTQSEHIASLDSKIDSIAINVAETLGVIQDAAKKREESRQRIANAEVRAAELARQQIEAFYRAQAESSRGRGGHERR